MTQSEAREAIQTRFRRVADRDVSLLARDQLIAEGDVRAAALCSRSHDIISERLWSQFSFDWSGVFFNPGGTAGRAATLLHSKVRLTYEWASAGGKYTEDALKLEKELLENLHLFWLEWAGYTLTSSPELEVAID